MHAEAANLELRPNSVMRAPSPLRIRRIYTGNEHKELKRKDTLYTRASIFLVVSFIVCNSPRLIPNCMQILLNIDDFPEVI